MAMQKNHSRDCYCMHNPNTWYATETRDITWLHHRYYSKPEARDKVVVYLQVALTFELEYAEAMEAASLNVSKPKIEF